MDELELLKKDWKKKENTFPKLSYDDIYRMIWKKSSSIVKWIFIISILEFVFWTAISFGFKDADYNQRFEEYGAEKYLYPLMFVGYIILLYFFYRFYMNYKRISVIDNAKALMEKILKTRRTVKHYVAFNLIYLAISFFLVLGIMLKKDDKMISIQEQAATDGKLLLFYAETLGLYLVVLAIIIGLILGFYYLIYGLLLRRLNRNYHELKKMEV